MKNFICLLSFIFITLTASGIASNDDCSGALLLTPQSVGTLSDALYQDLANSSNISTTVCAATVYRDLWYYFVATNDTMILVMQSYTSGLIPQTELLSGTCGSLNSLGCQYNGAITYTTLVPGTTYYLRAYDAFTQIKYDIKLLEKPTNDFCQTAFPLTVYRYDQPYVGQLDFWNYESTPGGNPCPASGTDNDVWFKFTATDTVHNIYFDGISAYYTCEYYSGNCGGLTSKGCIGFMNTDHATLRNLTIGQQYFFRLYSDLAPANSYVFRLTLTTLPSNNSCPGAITLPVSSSFSEEEIANGDLWFAAPSAGSCSSTLNDVWYKFTANANTAFVKTASSMESRVSVYSGGCASLNAIVCNDSSNNRITGLTSGNTYYIQLGQPDNKQNYYSIAVTPALNNDDCSGAVTLQPDDVSNNPNATEATFYSATQSMAPCAGTTANDVWFKFTANKQNYTLYATIPDYNLVYAGIIYEVFSGSCGSLTSLKCDTVKNAGDPINNLTLGQQYYIRMYATYGNTFHFSVGLVNGYDECEGAQVLQLTTAGSSETIQAYTTSNATQSMAPCSGSSAKDVWFTFTATQTNHSYIISETQPSNTFPVVELFSGTCGSLNSIHCKGATASVFYNLTPGQKYYIRVYSSGQYPFASFKIRVFSPPGNDDISNATPIPVTGSNVIGAIDQVTCGATASFGNFCASGTTGVFEDVWYYFVAPQTNQYITNASFGVSASRFGLEAYDQYNATAAIQSSQINCGNLSMAIPGSGTINAGDTIWLRVYADTSNSGQYAGAFDLAVSPASGTGNDEPSGAFNLNLGNRYQYIYTTTNMTLSSVANSCLTTLPSGEDLWFKFTATNLSSSIVSDELEAMGSSTELFSGTPGNLTSLGCSDNIMVLPTSLTPGQEYYIRVYHPVYSNGRIGYFFNDTLEKNNLVSINCLGPNLVPNPSMDCSTCAVDCKAGVVITGSQLAGYYLTDDWFMATDGSVDYYNSCANAYYYTGNAPSSKYGASNDKYFLNDIAPRNGKGYIGFFTYVNGNYREYPEVKLTQPLVPGTTYLVSFYVARGVSASFSVNKVGALLSCDKIIMTGSNGSNELYTLIPQTPQITWNDSNFISRSDHWVNVSAVITADKPYQYLTLGNFESNISTQISVPGVSDPTAFLNPYTSYMLLDDVVVAEVPASLDDSCKATVAAIITPEKNNSSFTVYPNPSNSFINWTAMKGMQQVSVFNINGSMMYNGVTAENRLDISSYLPGIYLIRIQNGDAIYIAKFIRKE